MYPFVVRNISEENIKFVHVSSIGIFRNLSSEIWGIMLIIAIHKEMISVIFQMIETIFF
jgi:hypothetical protein